MEQDANLFTDSAVIEAMRAAHAALLEREPEAINRPLDMVLRYTPNLAEDVGRFMSSHPLAPAFTAEERTEYQPGTWAVVPRVSISPPRELRVALDGGRELVIQDMGGKLGFCLRGPEGAHGSCGLRILEVPLSPSGAAQPRA